MLKTNRIRISLKKLAAFLNKISCLHFMLRMLLLHSDEFRLQTWQICKAQLDPLAQSNANIPSMIWKMSRKLRRTINAPTQLDEIFWE